MISRELEVFGEHTLDVSLLSPGDYVLDAGCRDFAFARAAAAHGCKVIAVDADPTVGPGPGGPIYFFNWALGSSTGAASFVMAQDPQARHLADVAGQSGDAVCVSVHTVEHLMEVTRVNYFAAVKLDIEGAEYEVLRRWPGPIAGQISVEFHEHVRPRPQSVYDEIFGHLGQWYDVAQHAKEARHCCAPNYWDSLFVLRGA